MNTRLHPATPLRRLPFLAVLLWLMAASVGWVRVATFCITEDRPPSNERLGEERLWFAVGSEDSAGLDRAKPRIGFLRLHDPNLQRWINRDPIGEDGGLNLYRFNYNDPLN